MLNMITDFDKIENFKMNTFKEQQQEKKEQKKEENAARGFESGKRIICTRVNIKPEAPSNLEYSFANKIATLTWIGNGDNVDSFEIYRKDSIDRE